VRARGGRGRAMGSERVPPQEHGPHRGGRYDRAGPRARIRACRGNACSSVACGRPNASAYAELECMSVGTDTSAHSGERGSERVRPAASPVLAAATARACGGTFGCASSHRIGPTACAPTPSRPLRGHNERGHGKRQSTEVERGCDKWRWWRVSPCRSGACWVGCVAGDDVGGC
jgi:hypothetical protein